MFNPATTTDTWLGNQTLNVAKFVVGGVNWSHYLIADGGELLAPLDQVVSDGTRAMYDAVFTTWIGPALLVLSVVLLVLAMRGDLARQTQRAGLAVVALVIGSAAYLAPVDWAKAADDLLLDGVTQMQEGFLGQVGLGDRDTLPTVLVDQVVYQNWLRGEFGSPDVPQAQQLGRELLRAQTFTKAEIAEHRDTMQLAAQKKAAFAAVGDRMGDRYPYFQGKSGSRVGAGLLAVVQAACIALFQLLSKVLVLVAMLVLRLLVMTAPGGRGGGRAEAGGAAGAAAGGRRGDRQHPGRRRAGRAARAAGGLPVPAGRRHRPVAVAAGHRGGDGGAVGGGAAVPAAGVDGVADQGAVRRDRARRRQRADVAGVAAAARQRAGRPADPLVGGAAAGRGRRRLLPGRWPAGGRGGGAHPGPRPPRRRSGAASARRSATPARRRPVDRPAADRRRPTGSARRRRAAELVRTGTAPTRVRSTTG